MDAMERSGAFEPVQRDERIIEALRRVIPMVGIVYGGSREANIGAMHLETGLMWLEKGISDGTIRLPE